MSLAQVLFHYHHLAYDLGNGEVPHKAYLPGNAELARHFASYLRQRQSVLRPFSGIRTVSTRWYCPARARTLQNHLESGLSP